MKIVKEPVKERWHYDGRRTIQGSDCYVWKRYLSEPDPETGFTTIGIALPVDTFWESR